MIVDISTINLNTNESIPTIYRALDRFVKQGQIHSEHNLYQDAKKKTELFQSSLEYFINPIHQTLFVDDINTTKLEQEASVK